MAYATGRFAGQGYHPTSVSEIVNGLGVGKGVFYWYFESKEALFREILVDAQTRLRRHQRRAIADEDDPLRRIEKGIRASLAWWAEHPELAQLQQFAATDERFLPLVRQGEQTAIGDVVGHLEDAIARGQIAPADPELLATAVLGASSRLARTYVVERHGPPEEVADACVSFCLRGVVGAR